MEFDAIPSEMFAVWLRPPPPLGITNPPHKDQVMEDVVTFKEFRRKTH